MKFIILIALLLTFNGCSKPKTVLICGDHVCINKAEAKQYFEDNLTLEVKIIDKNKPDEVDLVELNLEKNSIGKKSISISSKQKTNNDIKILSNKEIKKKRKEIKERKIAKKQLIKKELKSSIKKNNTKNKKKLGAKKNISNSQKNIVDICSILKECNIETISTYLIKQGKEKKFPDITRRE